MIQQLPQPSPPIIAVVYVLDTGAATVSELLYTGGNLVGAAMTTGGGQVGFVPADRLASTLASMSHVRRLYLDSAFATFVERWYCLSGPQSYDDVGVMLRLLGQDPMRLGLAPPKSTTPRTVQQLIEVAQRHAQAAGTMVAELREQLSVQGMQRLYEIELPVAAGTMTMQANGVRVDCQRLAEAKEAAERGLKEAHDAITQIVGRHVAVQDAPKVRKLVYEELGLAPRAWSPKGLPSTSEKALTRLMGEHPVISPIVAAMRCMRELQPLTGLGNGISALTGLVHAHLDPLGAETGRFTCSNPSLQSLPASMRSLIVPEPGYMLLEADFSQIELRVLGHFTQEPCLVQDLASGADLHTRTASQVLGVPEQAITAAQRQCGKAINFGIIFGETGYGLSSQLDLSRFDASRLIEQYFRAMPCVARWIASAKQLAHHTGYVTTLCGRRRYLPDLHASNEFQRAHAERQVVNTIIQGTAADLMKLALVRLHQMLPDGVRLLLTVHDSVLLEVPEQMVAEVSQQVHNVMEQPVPGFTVPLRVEIGPGATWADCKAHPGQVPIFPS